MEMFRFILTSASMAAAATLAWTPLGPAHAHDYKRPDLDKWYSSLHRNGASFPCCSKQDCHTTEAELRNGIWWARIGTPIDHDGRRDWQLGDYVRIPDELIVRGENGLPVPNPEGEAVLCHNIVWRGSGHPEELDPVQTTLFCFVPGIEG